MWYPACWTPRTLFIQARRPSRRFHRSHPCCSHQVHQRDERGADGLAEYIDLCVCVLRLGKDGSKTLVGTTGAQVDRQAHLQVRCIYVHTL